jgi:dienelactone hydrolase
MSELTSEGKSIVLTAPRRWAPGENIRQWITVPLLLVAAFVGAARAGVSATRVDIPTRSASPASLPGELTMPKRAGPSPAVIILHGCRGIPLAAREWLLAYAAWYADRGYGALILDSFAPRGVSTLCSGAGEPTPLTRALDAYRALEYLAGLGSIDPRRVVLQGHSHGGATVLTALDEITAEMAGTPLRFAGGVAYYPPCAYSPAEFYAPVLILIGEKDDWTPAADCERLRARQQALAPGRVRLIVYPGATHVFDVNAPPRRNEYGKDLAYDSEATRDAARQVEGFLHEVVK